MTTTQIEHFFEFPAIRCEQGGRVQYMMSAPMSMLKRILAFDAAGDVMSRSQRELNVSRAKKITRYLTEGYDAGGNYLLPTLIGNIDGEVIFREAAGVKGGLGTLSIPMDADIRLFDGQHRSRGIIDFITARRDSTDMITLLLTVGLSLETRQQFFSDINNNASKPATAISMAYNHKDPLNELIRHIASTVPALQERVDFEHNVVPAKSELLISFKALYDGTRKMFGLRAGDTVPESLRHDAVTIWDAWSRTIHWEWLAKYIGPAEYRAKHLGTHGVMVNAIGVATSMMLENHTADDLARMLVCDVHPCIEALRPFEHDDWRGVCVDEEKGTVKCDALAQNRAAEKLLTLFGLDTDHPDAWLRSCFDDTVSDEQVSDMAERVAKVVAEKKLDMREMKTTLPAKIMDNQEPLLTLGNMRRLRAWMKEQFPE